MARPMSERLRKEAGDLKAQGDRIVASLLDEAADEIDRLLALVAQVQEGNR